MEHIPQKELGRVATISLLTLSLFLLAGCVTLDSMGMGDCPPRGPVCRVVATWSNEVMFTPDPTKGGTPTPGIAGRVYLFGERIDFPQDGNGALVVDLLDASNPDPQVAPVPQEEWRFDKETLRRLQRKDAIGWGYTVFLPWSNYRPDLKKVVLKVRYEPTKGAPLYSEMSPLTLTTGVPGVPQVTVKHTIEQPNVIR